MGSAKFTNSAPSGTPRGRRSKESGTIATWRTNRKLKIVGATRLPDAPLRALPEVDQEITPRLPRRGILRHEPHAQALRGRSTEYEFRLFHQLFRVLLRPRYDRRGRILGVRGTLSILAPNEAKTPEGRTAGPSEVELEELVHITRRRREISVKSAIRSLELAKTVADTARMNAEIRRDRAADAQDKALQAQMMAEAEGRRARFLADASAMLDSSFDQRTTLDRVARLAVLRTADWMTIHFIDGDKLRRAVALHRDNSLQPLLDAAFPQEEESESLEPADPESEGRNGGESTRWELFPTLAPEDFRRLAPTGARRRALKELGPQSLIRTAIRSHTRLTGILILGSGDPGRLFDIQDLQMARDLAARIALARESSILFEEAQREIAMRKEIEARMRVLNTELERRVSERTRLLEETTREANSFAYTVAHDLRAPLRAITGFCQALKEDYAAAVDAVGQDYLDRIVTGARKMDALIRDLLDYARINRAEIKRAFLDLDPLIDEVLTLMTDELGERRADIQVSKPLGRVFAHGPVLAQVLTNLISNATKFVAPGLVPAVQIRTEARKNEVRILIRDNGIGIAPEHLERIFGIFERLNRAEDFPGTGIGLAIVRRAVERLGGKVGVESTLGVGSTFWLELPSA